MGVKPTGLDFPFSGLSRPPTPRQISENDYNVGFGLVRVGSPQAEQLWYVLWSCTPTIRLVVVVIPTPTGPVPVQWHVGVGSSLLPQNPGSTSECGGVFPSLFCSLLALIYHHTQTRARERGETRSQLSSRRVILKVRRVNWVTAE